MTEKLPPYAVRAGGLLLPKPIAGHPALELCNTLAGWDDPPDQRNEWLTTDEHVAVWAELHELLTPAPRGQVLDEVKDLRALAYRLLRHRDDSAFPDFAALATQAGARREFTRDGFRLRDHERAALHAATLAVADLLTSPARDTVRACPGHGCGWLFLDPRGRRVWCSMAACGNRSKVRAHAARNKGQDA